MVGKEGMLRATAIVLAVVVLPWLKPEWWDAPLLLGLFMSGYLAGYANHGAISTLVSHLRKRSVRSLGGSR